MNTAKGKTDYTTSVHRTNHDEYIGKTFGRWTVLQILPELSPNGSLLCLCRCSCEKHTEKIQVLSKLKSGASHSCGCERSEMWSKRNTKDLTGQTINDLTVLYLTNNRAPDGSRIWHCKCNCCGKELDVRSTFIIRGLVKRCPDCAQKQIVSAIKEANTIYTDDEREIVGALYRMIRRCENPNSDSYPWYGGRGIKVCQEWHDKRTFINWALSHGWKHGLTIERNNVDKDYCPENCCWIPKEDQPNNRTDSHFIYVDGIRYTKAQCSRIIGIDYQRMFKWDDAIVADIVKYNQSTEPHKRPHPFIVSAEKSRLTTFLGIHNYHL